MAHSKLVQTFLPLLALSFFTCTAFAQSLTTGDIAGSVTDPSGAFIANAPVTLTNTGTGAVQDSTTNDSGAYRFRLLKPGHYSIRATQSGFEAVQRAVEVNVGQVVTADLTLALGQATQTVEVSAATPLVTADPAQITSFTAAQVALLPSAGGDITNIAFTAPGAVVNTMGGYGNFTVNGLPGTSNLFTINGENDMDPYFNINNSGASNLNLGQNEIEEASIISNPYGGQYGQLAGAQVTYITKSGTNQFHGNAQYWWNGRALNANDWFNNAYGTDRPFANANQWAASLGGPILKNRTFFFVDAEGLRFVLPNVDAVVVPTPAFSSAVLANVQATQPNEYADYQKLLGFYAGAPGSANAQPIADSCGGLTSLPGFDPATQPCAARYQATPTALASEYIIAGRVDQRVGQNDNAYFRYKLDHGTQPTAIDPINSAFDAISKQPSWDVQANETHIFGPRATNSFMATLSHYVAQFQQGDQAASTFPLGIITSGSVPFTGFNEIYEFPQGRNITQYQIIDDYTLNRGKHNLKFGMNYRRYDVSDHTFFFNSPAVYFGYTANGLQNFADGVAYQYRQSLNLASDVPIALWGLGAYGQDEWNVTPHLKLTLALRLERNSNPVCQINCFANFNNSFNNLASTSSSDPGSVPYSSDIAYNQHRAYPGVDAVLWSPRVGFSWSPFADNKTVISGGIGIFYDSPPAGLVDDLLANPPVSVAIRVRPAGGVLPFDPNGGPATLGASASAFNIGETYSQISSSLKALGVTFAPPAFTAVEGTLHAPEWQEWNFQVQHAFTNSMALIVNYTGNHGIRIPYTNSWPNAYDAYGLYSGLANINTEAAVPNYGTVQTIQSGAISNYNGVTVTVNKQFSHGFAAHFNYTWAHNLDEVSNGGVFTYGDSALTQINPVSLRAGNYGNSDYDIRHNFSADFIYTPGYRLHKGYLQALFGGWQWSGKIFWRSSLPFSVEDANTALGNYSGIYLATPLTSYSSAQTTCGASSATTPCLNAASFLDGASSTFEGYSGLSGQTRNQFRGPHYFNSDMQLFKNFKLTERLGFAVGAQAFNVFNHPNFANPNSTVGGDFFGLITAMASTPTSPYGNFLGFDSSPRVVQVTGKFVF